MRASGGWGLGAGQADKAVDEDEDEEFDQAQLQERVRLFLLTQVFSMVADNEQLNADLNRMVGIATATPDPRRRVA